MKAMNITIATPHDLISLIRLEHECFAIDRIKEKKYKQFLNKPSVKIFIGKMQDKVIASAIIIFRKKSKTSRIYSFAVAKDFRRSGIAQTLYRHIEDYLAAQGCTEIYLEVKTDNLPAIQFYKKNGFVGFGEYKDYYEDRKDAIRMKKVLKIHQHSVAIPA